MSTFSLYWWFYRSSNSKVKKNTLKQKVNKKSFASRSMINSTLAVTSNQQPHKLRHTYGGTTKNLLIYYRECHDLLLQEFYVRTRRRERKKLFNVIRFSVILTHITMFHCLIHCIYIYRISLIITNCYFGLLNIY